MTPEEIAGPSAASAPAQLRIDVVRIAIVGCGKMGEAILAGWLSSDVGEAAALGEGSFAIVQPNDKRRESQVSQYGVCGVASVSQLSEFAKPFDIVVLAVKPQVMPDVLCEVASLSGSGAINSETLFVTIAAGVHTSAYEKALSGAVAEVRVVRVMPNMPLQVGMGASAVAGGANSSDDDVERVRALFSALGEAVIVSEDQIDAVCALSGGGPAYFAYMVEALGEAGRAMGLEGDLAEKLALATLGGTYHAIVEGDLAPAAMRESVCSPGGTTLAALASMDQDGFTPMIKAAMQAAVDRAAELRKDA